MLRSDRRPGSLRPDTWGMTAVLALLTAIGPLSTDMYLPSLPAIGRALAADVPAVQLTLSAYLLGFAAGQVIYGPLADRLGRRPVVLAGLLIYAAASALCALAPAVEWLVAARVLQALGAAGPVVLGRAMVRDLYEGSRAGAELSRMGMIMGLVPAVAPVLGGLLELAFGWRANFVATALASLVLAGLFWAAMPETVRARDPTALSLLAILRGFGVLIRHPQFRTAAALSGLAYGGLFAFISGSSFVLQGVYGLDPLRYGLSFAIVVLGYIAGTMLAQRIVGRRGLEGTARLGVIALLAGSLGMLLGVLFGPGWSLEVTLPMMLYTAGVGLTMPQANALAMMPFPDRAGAASSLQGLLQMGFAAAVGVGLAQLLGGSALPLPAVMLAIAIVAAAVARRLPRGAMG